MRAQLHAEIAAGFYERGQMDVALQELDRGGEDRPHDREDLQRLRPRLRDARQGRRRRAEFPQALELAPNDSEIRQNWGWYLCTHGQASESIPEFEQAMRNPLYKTPEIALINAGSAPCRSARTARRGVLRACAERFPNNPQAAFSLSQLAYKKGRLDDARALMKPVMQQNNRPPMRWRSACASSASSAIAARRPRYVSQLRNRYPDSAEAKSIVTGGCE